MTSPTVITIISLYLYTNISVIAQTSTDDEIKYFLVNIIGVDGHICVGTHITIHWILTTGTCAIRVANDTDRIKLVIGSNASNPAHGAPRYAKQVVLHHNYRPGDKVSNLGLIRITRPFDVSDHKEWYENGEYDGAKIADTKPNDERCVLYGWRQITFYRDANLNSVLMRSPFTMIPSDECKSKLIQARDEVQGFNEKQMFCGKDRLCIAEDGAPLFCENEVYGVLSNTHCTVAVFEKVTYYSHWIRSVIYYAELRGGSARLVGGYLLRCRSAYVIFINVYLEASNYMKIL